MIRTPQIGILGTGRMGVRLARMFAQAGRSIVLGSRDPLRARRIAAALQLPLVSGGSYDDAISAPAVLPAAFLRDGLLDWLEYYRHALSGKLYIDITNPFNADYSDFILPWNTSSAEETSRRFGDVRLVGAYKNVWWEVFDEPLFDGKPSDVFVVGDDAAAKLEFLALTDGTPFRYIDAGPLRNARTIERMTLLSGELGVKEGYFPRMNWRLLGTPWQSGRKDKVAELIAR